MLITTLYLTEFDEDDPLAGLLSDEDDDPKPKPKKSPTPKKAGSSGISSQGSLPIFQQLGYKLEISMR